MRRLVAVLKRYFGPVVVVAAGVVLAIVIVATGPEVSVQPAVDRIPIVETVRARSETVRMSVTAHGAVVPKTQSNLVAEVSGSVVSVAPAMVSGGFFKKGDVLVEIERLDYDVALERARANLASAESELDNAEKAYERRRELTESDSISQSQHDDALNRLAVARASLRAATAQVSRAERDLERTRLVAPYDGRVRSERVDPGQFVNRGESVAALYSVDFAEVRLPVRDEDLAFLPISIDRAVEDTDTTTPVVLRASFAGRDRTWHAKIVRTEGELDPQTRMVNLIAQVEAPYDQPGDAPPLTVGLFVEAEIVGSEFEGIVSVPRSAVMEGDRVRVVTPDNRLEFRPVDVLRRTGDTIFLSDGVRDGESICLSELPTATEGQRVQTASKADETST
ncbi:MAG: efflux RND transporter periplasmic adaptor subunit [Gammaproteobacteria bacterium]|nr:efflux RND transporter periplasmic adaptor subunit [Gammaproteobacteria bacterium]MDE0192652.1 efflux RND transporter periplasmic adaptor subunit [Gammaproteobacteria bacterium]